MPAKQSDRNKRGTEYWVLKHRRGNQFVFDFEPIPDTTRDQLDDLRVMDGFGYYGILQCDAQGETVQCHVCGKWLVHLGCHVRVHGYTADTYKEDFELGRTTGLTSPRLKLEAQERGRAAAADGHLVEWQGHIEEYAADTDHTPSLSAKLHTGAMNRSARRAQQVSEGRKRLFATDPEAYARQVEHMRRIRPPIEVSRANGQAPMRPESRAKLSATRTAQAEPKRQAIRDYVYKHPGCTGLEMDGALLGGDLFVSRKMRQHYTRQLTDRGDIVKYGDHQYAQYYPPGEAPQHKPSPQKLMRLRNGWILDDDGTWHKPCPSCGRMLTLDHFYHKGSSIGHQCKDCVARRYQERKAAAASS